MCSEPNVSYVPIYKSFKFSDDNDEAMKKAKSHDKTGSQDSPVSRDPNVATEHKGDEPRKARSGRNGSVDYELPELVVFLQESSYHFVKDMCADKIHGNCEIDHKIVSRVIDADVENKRGSGSSVHKSNEEIEPESLLWVGEVQKAVSASVMTQLTAEKKDESGGPVSEADRGKDSPDNEPSRATPSGTTEILRAGKGHSTPEDATPRGLAESTSQVNRNCSDESSLVASGRFSGHEPSFRSASHRSNSSTTSSRSFAFPVLASEWHGSPERMVRPDKRQLKKRRGKCARFFCCKF